MKKLALTIVCGLAVAGAAFGQEDLVSFTPTRTIISFETNATVYSPLFGGGSANGTAGVVGNPVGGLQYDFTLLYMPTTVTPGVGSTTVWNGSWQDTGLTATNSSNFSTSGTIAPVGPTATIVPWDTGTTDNIVLVGWSVNLGTTWGVVSNLLANWSTLGSSVVGNAFFGESIIGYITPNTSPAPGAGIFGSAAGANGLPIGGLLTPLDLLPVPEPATMALAGLGGLSLLLFRRKRS